MSDVMLTRREGVIWAAAFVAVSILLVVTRFASDDPDSALYAQLAARLATLPVAQWIAPEWWGQWNSEGWFREHPAGMFLLPTAMGAVGIPAIQASYIVGIGAGLASLLLIGNLVRRVTTPADARAALILLQLMPVAFLFRIRANHEYPMLLCLVLCLVAIDEVRRSWVWAPVVAFAVMTAVLVKGVFVVMVLIGAGWWALVNPTRQRGSIARPIGAGLLTLIVVAFGAYAYDGLYVSATGDRFWWAYWQRQLGPIEIATPIDGASTLLDHAVFYAIRLAWHPAPWSAAVVIAVWRYRATASSWWQAAPVPARRALAFVALFTVSSVAILLPSSRFAERYAFAAIYAVATAGTVIAYRDWNWVRSLVLGFDARVPAFPVVLWFVLMVARLALGPFLPRIS